MQFAWYDLLGSIGVAMIILTYIALQIEKIRSEQLIYSLLNAVGASLVVLSLCFSFNFSAFIVEFFWVLISLYGIGKYFLRKKNKPRTNTDEDR
jgi:multisubunit Na+/H+ antiporter MnhB subunit